MVEIFSTDYLSVSSDKDTLTVHDGKSDISMSIDRLNRDQARELILALAKWFADTSPDQNKINLSNECGLLQLQIGHAYTDAWRKRKPQDVVEQKAGNLE
jgi:hypothetical protein